MVDRKVFNPGPTSMVVSWTVSHRRRRDPSQGEPKWWRAGQGGKAKEAKEKIEDPSQNQPKWWRSGAVKPFWPLPLSLCRQHLYTFVGQR